MIDWWQNTFSCIPDAKTSVNPRLWSDPRCLTLFNIGCIGRGITSLLSAYIMMTSETVYFKVADPIALLTL